MNAIRAIQKLNKRELEDAVAPEASWHTDYRDTAFVNFGGLPFELSEGDIITLFSQYGEPVWIKLARDRETGKSRGFGWLKYEDQRSTDLAVDNLGGATVMGRVLRVDHARYKPRDDEDMRDNTMGEPDVDEEEKRRKRRRTDSGSESESDEDRPVLPEEIELEKLIRGLDDDDPMKASMVRKKRDEVEAALRKWEKARRKEKEKQKKHRSRRHHRDRDESRERGLDKGRIKEEDENELRSAQRGQGRNGSTKAVRSRFDTQGPLGATRRDEPGARHNHRDKDNDRSVRERRRYSSDEAEDRHSRSKHSSRRYRSPDDQDYRNRGGDHRD